MPNLVKRENPERNPVWEAFMGSHVLLTRRESTWQQMVVYKCLNHGENNLIAALKLITRHKPWGKQGSLILLLIPSLFKCQMTLCFVRFNSNSSEINISEIIVFWISCLRSRSDQLWKSWGKPLEYCETISSLDHYHSIFFPHVMFSIRWRLFCSLLEWWV